MTELTRDEVNRYCHEKIRGLCWHELGFKVFDPSDRSRTGRVCPKCRTFFRDERSPNNPDYCSNSESRSLLNEVVAATSHAMHHHDGVLGFFKRTDNSHTAEQIARAAVEAWEARDDG